MNKLEYTGAVERICAFLIDMVFLMIFSFMIYALALIFTIPSILNAVDQVDAASDINFAIMACWLAYIILGVFYFPVMESSKYQASLGKYILKMKLVDTKGKGVSFFRAFIRFIIFAFFSKIVIWTIPFTKQKKGIHDIICDTRVVNKSH